MAGVYIHIPFCKQACHYCNFHFSTTGKYKGEMVEAICKEMELRGDYLEGAEVQSIYLGGGTPSLLTRHELEQIFDTANTVLNLGKDVEITLEANPDDLDRKYVKDLQLGPVNRLSIGIQSFFDRELEWMNRSHNAEEAFNCIRFAREAGFENITADLIYGVPQSTLDSWEKNLDRFYELGIPHLSAYCLTVEPRTALAHFVKSGQSPPPDDELANDQFNHLIERMERNSYLHYEISNFGKAGFLSRHNSSYWKGIPYLGLGPSAHSFNGTSRQWNVANNVKYMKAITEGVLPAVTETIDQRTQYNEYIMTALRTMWGVEEKRLSTFGAAYESLFREIMESNIEDGLVRNENGAFILTKAGKSFADRIAMEAFAVEDTD